VSTLLTGRFDDALAWASALHRTQVRKGTPIPYVAHLLAVASLALEAGATEDEAIAALLHDAVEDQGGAPILAEIRARYGAAVADIVDGCTDTDQDPKPAWRPRKEAYLAHLPAASASVRLVSVCDKVHNARSILADYRVYGEQLWPRFSGGREGTLWYYRELAKAYRKAGMSGGLLDELERTIEELHRLVRA
jgi:(p)ppGpp synthase/HD superfamily hydrolase